MDEREIPYHFTDQDQIVSFDGGAFPCVQVDEFSSKKFFNSTKSFFSES